MAKPILACPRCGAPFEGHLAVGRAAEKKMRVPLPGCTLLCFSCGEICVMADNGTARVMTEPEAMQLPADVVALLFTCEQTRQQVMREGGRDPFGGTS